MGKNFLKILFIFVSIIYLISFFEASDVERNQNYGNEEHSYVLSSDQSHTNIKIQSSPNFLFHTIIINGIDNQLPVSLHSYVCLNLNHAVYSPPKIYITNSVFLI